jgi:hypothetical protein
MDVRRRLRIKLFLFTTEFCLKNTSICLQFESRGLMASKLIGLGLEPMLIGLGFEPGETWKLSSEGLLSEASSVKNSRAVDSKESGKVVLLQSSVCHYSHYSQELKLNLSPMFLVPHSQCSLRENTKFLQKNCSKNNTQRTFLSNIVI